MSSLVLTNREGQSVSLFSRHKQKERGERGAKRVSSNRHQTQSPASTGEGKNHALVYKVGGKLRDPDLKWFRYSSNKSLQMSS